MKITATIAGILHVNSRKSRGFWIPHVNRKEGACIGPFLSKVKHISLSLVLGRSRSGYWEGKHQFYSPFLQEPQVEVVIMPTEAGGVVQRWSAYGKCREGWDRQSAPAPSFGDVGSLLLDSVTCGFSWHPGKENLAFASHIHPQHIHTQLPWLWTREQAHTTVLLTKSSCMSRDCQFETRPQLCYQLFLLHTEYRESTACRVIL